MTSIDYNAPAELYLGSDRQAAAAQGPRRFRTLLQALRFAFEEAAPVSLRGAQLIAEGRTYSAAELNWLYRSADYPLARKRQRANAKTTRPALERAA